MKIDLLEWLKYLGLTFASGIALSVLCMLWIWVWEQIAKARGGYIKSKQAIVLGPMFRQWLRNEVKTNPDIQKKIPKDQYPELYQE